MARKAVNKDLLARREMRDGPERRSSPAAAARAPAATTTEGLPSARKRAS